MFRRMEMWVDSARGREEFNENGVYMESDGK